MRLAVFALVMCISTGAQAQSVRQACLVIDGLDIMHAIQTRLARNPDTILFADDIRVLRAKIGSISDRAALEAIQSNSLAIKGNTFLRFLQNTRALLQKVSMDDPDSITPHFNTPVRRNLSNISRHLVNLRCPEDEIAAAEDELALSGGIDAEGDDAIQIIREAANELVSLKNFIVFSGVTLGAVAITRLWQHLSARQRRRAKRHATRYKTSYRLDNATHDGVVIDINCFGVKLRHGANLPVTKGSQINISMGDEWVTGKAMWSNAHYVGVQLNPTISLAMVDQVCNPRSKITKTQSGAPMAAAS